MAGHTRLVGDPGLRDTIDGSVGAARRRDDPTTSRFRSRSHNSPTPTPMGDHLILVRTLTRAPFEVRWGDADVSGRDGTTTTTTVGALVERLRRAELAQELADGRRGRVIYLGRVLRPEDDVAKVVPRGATVHVVASEPPRVVVGGTGDEDSDDDVERGGRREDPVEADARVAQRIAIESAGEAAAAAARAPRMSRRAGRATAAGSGGSIGDSWDFLWGFGLGYVVGPLVLFWAFEQVSHRQRLGLIVGISLRTLIASLHFEPLAADDAHDAAVSVHLNPPDGDLSAVEAAAT